MDSQLRLPPNELRGRGRGRLLRRVCDEHGRRGEQRSRHDHRRTPGGLTASLAGVTAEDELLIFEGEEQPAPAGSARIARKPVERGRELHDGVIVQPGDTLVLKIPVAASVAGSVTNVVRVSGGGAPSASVDTPTPVFASEAQAREQGVWCRARALRARRCRACRPARTRTSRPRSRSTPNRRAVRRGGT